MKRRMTERNEIALPPAWCSKICKNALNEACIEFGCAFKRDCSQFELKEGTTLVDLPQITTEDFKNMTPQERTVVVWTHLNTMKEFLLGGQNDRRPFTNRSRSSPFSKNLQESGLPSHPETETSVYQSLDKEDSSKGNGS